MVLVSMSIGCGASTMIPVWRPIALATLTPRTVAASPVPRREDDPTTVCLRARHAIFDRARQALDAKERLAILRDLPHCAESSAPLIDSNGAEFLVASDVRAFDLADVHITTTRLSGKVLHAWRVSGNLAKSMGELGGKSPTELATWAGWATEPVDQSVIDLSLSEITHARAITMLRVEHEADGMRGLKIAGVAVGIVVAPVVIYFSFVVVYAFGEVLYAFIGAALCGC